MMTTRRDRGAALPLVLVLIVIGALIVVPVMSYAITVLRANRVESQHTREVEGAKAGVRMALGNPTMLFQECDQPVTIDLDPSLSDQPIESQYLDEPVHVACRQLDAIGPTEQFGNLLHHDAVATQLGAEVPNSFGPTRFDVTDVLGAVPPYPVDSDPPAAIPPEQWYGEHEPRFVDADSQPKVWIPDVPGGVNVSRGNPNVVRDGTPFDMPSGYDLPGRECKVFLPGYYPGQLTLDQPFLYYFASGIYYFENTVTISHDADVIVGQGIADWGTGCADDLQVGANVTVPAGTSFAIDGGTGGATWVFGDRGRLVIDNSATTDYLSVRFNQRYAPRAHGAWVSIMSVNGDENSTDGHNPPHVNSVPRSQVLSGPNAALQQSPISTSGPTYFVPSDESLTDEARAPELPQILTVEPVATGTGTTDAALMVTFSGVEGADTNGALLDRYEVRASRSGSSWSCTEVVPTVEHSPNAEVAGDPDEYSCVIEGLREARSHAVEVRAVNAATTATSPWASTSATTLNNGPLVEVPDPVDAVQAAPYDDASLPNPVHVSWDPPDPNGSPIDQYRVKAYVVVEEQSCWPASPVDPICTPVPAEVAYAVDVDGDGTTIDDPDDVCTSAAPIMGDPDLEWAPAPTSCVFDELPPLPPDQDPVTGARNLGYRFFVVGHNTEVGGRGGWAPFPADPADPSLLLDPDGLPTLEFTAPAVGPSGPPTLRVVTPRAPNDVDSFPIIDIRLDAVAGLTNLGRAIVDVPGYVSVPMGQVRIVNEYEQGAVRLAGGIVAGTFSVQDDWDDGTESNLPYGYDPSIVLQRRMRVWATAGGVTSTALVEVNEDGQSYGVLAWSTQ